MMFINCPNVPVSAMFAVTLNSSGDPTTMPKPCDNAWGNTGQKTAPILPNYEKRDIVTRIDGMADMETVTKTLIAVLEN